MNTPDSAAVSGVHRTSKADRLALCFCAAAIVLGCSSGSSSSSTSTSSSSSSSNNAYANAYKSVSWGATVSVSYPSSCEMSFTTTGKPDYTPNPYYLGPANAGQTVVAHTSITNTPLALTSYANNIEPGLHGSSATINICPTQASTTTATGLGAIGYLISGTAMFNPFEMDASTAAVADNASYTFTDATGTSQTAYFLDQCGSHSNGTTWHAHGNPNCVTSQVDTAAGPSHIIGIALDGFPIYGGRDINGNIINVSQLDACNGINSATPEFPNGAYHYVLPIGVTTKYASINCYSGTVSPGALAAARKLACDMKTMLAMSAGAQPASKAVRGMAMQTGTSQRNGAAAISESWQSPGRVMRPNNAAIPDDVTT